MDIKYTAMKTGHWLQKANAPAVFACMIVLFLAMSGIWAYRLMSDTQRYNISTSERSRGKNYAPLGIIALIESTETTLKNSFPSVSPFAGAPARHKNPRTSKPEIPPVNISAGDPVINLKHPETAKKERPELDRPETVSLIYKGIFKRTDGVSMALIEDSKTGRSRFYQKEAHIFGMTLNEINTDTLKILQENGESMELKRDKSAVFVEGRHAP